MREVRLLCAALVWLVAGWVFLDYAISAGLPAGDQDTGPLRAAEISIYEGNRLSSVNDFRENSIKGPQYVDRKSYRLSVTGLVEAPAQYGYDEIVRSYRHYKKVVTLNCVEGWSVRILWEGVPVRDLIESSKPSAKAKIVIFHAYDGYTTSFPLEYIMDQNILLAYKMNNIVLPPERGFPFVLVAEGRWGYKWIKWITGIELSDDVTYQGYWERRGYSDSGEVNKGFSR